MNSAHGMSDFCHVSFQETRSKAAETNSDERKMLDLFRVFLEKGGLGVSLRVLSSLWPNEATEKKCSCDSNRLSVIVVFCLQGPGWEYETELPDWADVNWVDLEPTCSE